MGSLTAFCPTKNNKSRGAPCKFVPITDSVTLVRKVESPYHGRSQALIRQDDLELAFLYEGFHVTANCLAQAAFPGFELVSQFGSLSLAQ
jgi:hypothetical protein